MDPVSTISYLQKVKDQKRELTFPCLIDFGSCNLHSVHENVTSREEIFAGRKFEVFGGFS